MSQTSSVAEVNANPSAEPDTLQITPARPPLQVTSHGLTDRGRLRPANEDQFLIASLTKALQVEQSSLPQPQVRYSHERGHLFIVADGMGGHAGGQQASALAVQTIEGFMLDTLKWFFHLKGNEGDEALAEFQKALARADDRVIAEAAQHPELRGMGTTVTMAYSVNADLFVVHVGDSRGYLFRRAALHRLTRDHTMVSEMVRIGVLQPEQAAHHQLRHVITNVVGGTSPGVQVEVHKLRLEAGDVLLLCSDGLTEMLSDEEIRGILEAEPDARALCRCLVDRANEQGGRDNITVIVARYEATA